MSYEIDIRKLSTFNSMAKEGGEKVAENLGMMLGKEVEMKITQINFVDVKDIKEMISSDIGIEILLSDPPYGHLLLAFDRRDGKEIANLMLEMQGLEPQKSGNGIGEMEMSAIKEAGNIVASGFIDGWANVLNAKIDITTPNFTDNPAEDSMEKMEDNLAIIFGSHLQVSKSEIDIVIYVFPKLKSLVHLIQDLKK